MDFAVNNYKLHLCIDCNTDISNTDIRTLRCDNCKKIHSKEYHKRYAKEYISIEENRKQRNDYRRKWRKDNPDKEKAQQKRDGEKRKRKYREDEEYRQSVLIKEREKYHSDEERKLKILERNKISLKNNPHWDENRKRNCRIRHNTDPEVKRKSNERTKRNYHEKYKFDDNYQESQRTWRKENPDKLHEMSARRRAAQLNSIPSWLSKEQLEEISKIYKEAQEDGLTVDHKIPLQGNGVCGLHVPWNMQLMTLEDNTSKYNNYDPDEDFLPEGIPRKLKNNLPRIGVDYTPIT